MKPPYKSAEYLQANTHHRSFSTISTKKLDLYVFGGWPVRNPYTVYGSRAPLELGGDFVAGDGANAGYLLGVEAHAQG
jgi:hypothetical protein